MKKFVKIISIVLIMSIIVTAALLFYQKKEREQYGILLAFDDYSQNWDKYFDLLDEYDVKVTYFVNLKEPDEFCTKAQERGHEIGYHTSNHSDLTKVSREEFYEVAIEPINAFRTQGFPLTSFAYPYGEYEEWMHQELLAYYDTVRGAWYYRGYTKDSIYKGYVESKSIDNLHFEDDEHFRRQIREWLEDLVSCDKGTVVSLFSHSIGAGDWCITENRLRILFEEADRLGIKFYTFQQLQKY